MKDAARSYKTVHLPLNGLDVNMHEVRLFLECCSNSCSLAKRCNSYFHFFLSKAFFFDVTPGRTDLS